MSTFNQDVVGNGLGQDDTFGVVGMGGFVIPKNTFIATTPGRDYGQGAVLLVRMAFQLQSNAILIKSLLINVFSKKNGEKSGFKILVEFSL